MPDAGLHSLVAMHRYYRVILRSEELSGAKPRGDLEDLALPELLQQAA